MNTPSQDTDLLKSAAQALGEHFDTVQIFTTRHESGELDGTVRSNYGCGNWYARYGQVRQWVIMEDEAARELARKREESE